MNASCLHMTSLAFFIHLTRVQTFTLQRYNVTAGPWTDCLANIKERDAQGW